MYVYAGFAIVYKKKKQKTKQQQKKRTRTNLHVLDERMFLHRFFLIDVFFFFPRANLLTTEQRAKIAFFFTPYLFRSQGPHPNENVHPSKICSCAREIYVVSN
jgi:hypothetical protein